MQEESPEGGRFKKEIVVDGQSYLLLIRDEGGPPELQVRKLYIPLVRIQYVHVLMYFSVFILGGCRDLCI